MNTQPVRICVPVCAREIRAFEEASKEAAQCGDIIELRVDCLDTCEPSRVEALTKTVNRLAIVTFRPREQGGHCDADSSTRRRFWNTQIESSQDALFDIELDLLLDNSIQPDWQRVICSHHDFNSVPANLDQIYASMAKTPARIFKIAVNARDVVDCIPLFRLIDRARKEGKEIIAVAMGLPGIATRILGPSRGNYLTYGSLDADRGTAPGQISARELRELYRIDRISRDTQVLGILGLPVGHSISPNVHNAAFASAGLDAVYLPFEVRDLPAFITRMAHPRSRELDWNLTGLSVTAPHKTAVMDYLDWIDPAAREIGAVNTIVITADGFHGYNTDALAALKPVEKKLGSLRDSRCALLGAGGVARALLWSLRRNGVHVTLFSRNLKKGSALAEKFGAEHRLLNEASLGEFDFVVNATPLGTQGVTEGSSPATIEQLRGARLAYDLVYNPDDTLFMQQAREAGCEAIGGLSMFVLQAAEQFKLWTGVEAPAAVMQLAAEQAFS